MIKNYLKLILLNLFVFSFLFTSCVDQDFDLSKDIDLNIHVGGNGLALPIGNTDSIKLSKIIKVDESDVLHLSGGEYSLLKEDVADPVKVTVNSVDPIIVAPIYLPTITLSEATLSLFRTTSGSINIEVPPTTAVFELKHSNMPVEVRSIKNIFVPASSPVKTLIKFTLTGVNSNTDVRFSNFKVTFPDFIVSEQLNANHELILNENVVSGLTKEIYISGFNFSNEQGGTLVINNRLLELAKDISISGGITASNLDASSITEDIKLGTSILADPLTISQVEGQVDPSINVNIDPISLDIPDFLEDDAVTMDVENPMIRLNVTNEIDVPIIINGLLKGYRSTTLLSEVAIKGTSANPITIDANGKTVICLSRTGKGGPAGSKNYQIADLNNLIAKIPDHIRFTMDARADQSSTHKIQLGRTYNVGIDYAVEVPFKFGSGLSIVYNDSIDDFNEDIKDLDVKSLTVTTTVENNIPLELQLQATPVGVNKSAGALPGVSVKVTGGIKPCDANGKTQESPLVIELTETTVGAIKNLDGLLLKITAKSTETVNGMPLKENQYIRLKNIKAKASSGIDVNLNDK